MRISPIHVARTAKSRCAARFNMWKFANYADRRFRGDVRYNPQAVTAGFSSCTNHSDDDSELLNRICEAYIKAVSQQQFAPAAYQSTEWWQSARQGSMKPVVEALLARNIDALRKMYQNFYRDPCSSGLLGAPNGMSKAFFGGTIKDAYRRFYLGHVLCRLDYWKEQTGGDFGVPDLAGPGIGNPFGAVIEGIHIAVGAEYAHYCAHRIISMLGPNRKPVVAEIGGGFGGMAYFLLRDRPALTYLNFDVPERVALISYYLLKAFPGLRFLLYGDGELTEQTLSQNNVILMPAFSLPAMPPGSVDAAFTSHGMSKAPVGTTAEYLKQIERMTRASFLCIADKKHSELIADVIRQRLGFELAEARASGWYSYKVSGAGVGGARRLADSTVLEQVYERPGVHRKTDAYLESQQIESGQC